MGDGDLTALRERYPAKSMQRCPRVRKLGGEGIVKLTDDGVIVGGTLALGAVT